MGSESAPGAALLAWQLTMELMPDSGSAKNLIAELRQLGITIWVDNGRLRYKAPQGGLTPELKQRLVDNKDEVLHLLSGSTDVSHESRLPPVVARPMDQER